MSLAPFADYDAAPLILIFSDGAAAESRALAEAAGARAVVVAIEDAIDRLALQGDTAGAIVDLRDDPGDLLEPLLAALVAGTGDRAALVIAPLALTDRAFAATDRSAVVLIVAPDAIDRATEVGLLVSRATRRAPALVAEPSARLRQLSDEMVRIGQLLGALSAEVADLRATLPDTEAPRIAADPNAIRGVIRARRLRDRFFGGELFADPAWDMLLDLAAARLEHRRVAVSSLCIAAAVPPTTALRWIRSLVEAGLFERHADPEDGRRVFIAISERGANAMAAYFAAAAAAGIG